MSNDFENDDIQSYVNAPNISPESVQELEAEFDEVKNKIIDITTISGDALSDLAKIAHASQHPMYYDSLSKLIIAATRANKEAGAIIAAKAELHKNNNGSTATVVSHDANGEPVVVTTTADMIGQILGAKKH